MNVPKLRFREFTDEYINYKFRDVATLYRGSSPRPIIEFMCKDGTGVNWIKIGDTNEKETYINTTSEQITLDGSKKSRKVYKGDIILSNSMSFGRPFILNIDGCIHDGWFVIRDYEKILHDKYLYHFMTSPIIQNQYKRLSAGGVVSNISSELVYSVNIKVPTKIEQIKVAKLITLLDKKIELQSKKIEALKLYKICTINNVFKTSDNSIYLKKLCNVKTSNISLNDIENDIGNYPLYGANGYIKNISSYQFNNDYVAIIKDGAGVGKTYICCKNSSILGTMNALFPIDIDINYLNILLTRIKFKKYIVGSGIPHIYFKDYKNELIKIHEKETQEIIGNYIEKLNSKILYEEKKYNKLIKLKKGLMQNMFI